MPTGATTRWSASASPSAKQRWKPLSSGFAKPGRETRHYEKCLTRLAGGANNQSTNNFIAIDGENSMGMIQEFKEFAVKGNAMDLAVGVIIGGAFGKIVDSIVGDLIMPLVSRVVGKLDFSNLFVILGDNPNNLATLADLKKAGIPVFAYGSFLTIVVNFVILAFIIFMMVKQLNRLRTEEPAAAAPEEPPATPEDVLLLREIRDSLKK